MHLFYRKHAPFFTITSLFSHFKKKNDPFRSTFFTSLSRFFWHIWQPPVHSARIRLHTSTYFPVFRITLTLGKSEIQKVAGECTVICKALERYFQGIRHLISMERPSSGYCELPNVWHINIDFTAMKTVVAAIFCAPHGKTTFSAHSFYPWNNRSQNIYHRFTSYFCVFLTRSNQQKSLFRWQDFFLRAFQLH